MHPNVGKSCQKGSQRDANMEPTSTQNRAFALKLDPQILSLFTIVEPPQALKEGTKTAQKRHHKIKSLFRHPFSGNNVQNRLPKDSIWASFFAEKWAEIQLGRLMCLRGAQSTPKSCKNDPQAPQHLYFGKLLH